MKLPFAEPYKIKSVETVQKSTLKQRTQWIKEAKYNLFNLKSSSVFIDLLTDSGTGAMSNNQWAAIMQGDESYAGSSSFFELKDRVKKIFGFEYFLPTHQGRAAENVLFSAMIKEGDIVPGNAHFDTTKGHIEFRKATAVDCTIDEASDTSSLHPFKGNIDLKKLEKVLKEYGKEKIPVIIITATCNTAGGQPVSLENITAVHKLAWDYEIPVIIDAARFAENAYFIKQREEKYKDFSIPEIVKKMFFNSDGMTMSAKKDGIVNIGGFIGLRNEELYRKATTFNIMFEGFINYGGMAGRDMAALAVGLNEVLDEQYLESRIRQVDYLGQKLISYGIPVQQPIGGHAVFVDATEFYKHIDINEFRAQILAIELYLESGVRGVEIGALLADRDPISRKNRFPKVEMLRLAIPRRVYTYNHMDYVAAALKNVFDRRHDIKNGYQIIQEAPIMRHFTLELRKI
ncbi:MAG: tryptophanase [Bacteroidales bacterium]|nr:tryptophanase [Bacteroidales bacterium]MCF8390141.1 tryptophanase [Bacteroidales bacterium]